MAVEKNIIRTMLVEPEDMSKKQRFLFLYLLVSLMFFFSPNVMSQRKLEVGGLVGGAYYIGDFNPGVPFLNTHLALGGLARYVVNDRIAIKGSALFTGLSGSYDPGKVGVLPVEVKSFDRKIGSVEVGGEINLFSYDHEFISSTVFTPYITLGVGSTGYRKVTANDTSTVIALSLPVGIGVKYKISKWVRVGAEWSFKKLFDDSIDLYDSEGSKITHNNDWFSVLDIYITFGFVRRKVECNGLCNKTTRERIRKSRRKK